MNQWIAVVSPRTSWTFLTAIEKKSLLNFPVVGFDIRIPYAMAKDSALKDEYALAQTVLNAGKRLRLHHWSGVAKPGPEATRESVADAAAGAKQGAWAAELAQRWGAESIGNNAESDVWRGKKIARGVYANPKANEFLDAYAGAFHEFFNQPVGPHQADLGYLGYTDPDGFYLDVDLDGDGYRDDKIKEIVKNRYQRCHVMAYQSTLSALTKKLDAARKEWPNHPRTAWAGVGRKDKTGFVWGNAQAWLDIAKNSDSVIDEITWYVGNEGAWKMIFEGRSDHAPLSKLIPRIAETKTG